VPTVTFPWLESSAGTRDGADPRLAVAQAELRDRAALLHRLGYSAARAAARCRANVAWDYATTPRPAGLDDAAIKALVDEVYKRQRA
jgi:hypothetical protein